MALMDDEVRRALDEARRRRDEALSERARAVALRAAAAQQLRAIQARHGADHADARAVARRLGAISENVKSARTSARDARGELQDLLALHLPRNPEDDVALLNGDDPIVLLPVRLETRFERRVFDEGSERFAGVLKVRLYPDAIAADSHEPRLSAAERDAGLAFWRKAWGDAGEGDAWTALTASVPPARAAWIVRATTPTNFAADFPASPGSTGPGPAFPDVDIRPDNWQRHPCARVLPDRWVVLTYRGDSEVRRKVSEPIIEPLSLSMTFSSDGDEPGSNDTFDLSAGLTLDDEIAWTLEFPRALKAGMGVELPLTQQDLDEGFTQLIAIGVKPSLSPAQASARLTELIDAHHYSRGFSFVPQGAPTNNVSEVPSWFPQPDPRGERSFRVERGAPLVGADTPTDGVRFMRALGVPIESAAHVAGADGDEQRTAGAMVEALWPCTLGYFLEHMMRPVVDDAAYRQTRQYVLAHVRARGPYPAFRVGDTPYGLLPVTFIDDWDAYDDPTEVERHLKPLVIAARDIFARFVSDAARIGRSADADADLLETLGMDASAREAWVRRVLGSETTRNFARFCGFDPAAMDPGRQQVASSILTGLRHPEWDPRVLYTNFSDPPFKFARGLVVNDPDDPLSESAALDFNYINWLRTAPTITTIRDQAFPAGLQAVPQSLLYRMLRHGALQQYTRVALDILIDRNIVGREVLRDRELIGIAAEGRDAPTVWQHLQVPVTGVTGGRPIDAVLTLDPTTTDLPPLRDLEGYRASLAVLEDLPTAELDRLFTETLDVSSHRVDAWMTSMAARRLNRIREERPTGCHLAAFGWVEDLRADPPSAVRFTEVEGRRVRLRSDSGGYVHTPSMTHGATAAVLLNAYLTRHGVARDRYAVDLSSRRTRIALQVLDAVRNGQPIGAVLGYQFERGLHEGHPEVELDRFIDDFRTAYPIARNEARDANEPTETITARNVVDGLALRLAWRGEPGFDRRPWEAAAEGTPERVAIEAELARLDETVDAVADLLLADSVFQITSGKMDAAGTSLKAIGEGVRPPEGEVTRAPRTGTALTYRVAVILGGAAIDLAATWGGPRNERARAEPHLNGWVGSVLGDPASARCDVHFASGTVEAVTLDLLQIDPLDFLVLARAAETSSDDAEIDRRVRLAAVAAAVNAGHAPPPATDSFSIRYDPDTLPAAQRSIASVLEAARALNELLGVCRPLTPQDLVPPERTSDLSSNDPAIAPDLMGAELQARADAALNRFTAARATLAGHMTALAAAPEAPPPTAAMDALRASLRVAAAFGVAGAFPRTFTGDAPGLRADLTTQAMSVIAEMERREAQSAAAPDPVSQLQGVFGRDFVVLPRFRPARPDALQPALDEPPQLGADPGRVRATWGAQTARVRKQMALWRRVQQYARAFLDPAAGSPPAGHVVALPRVAQLPFAAGARWVGLPFSSENDRPPRGLISLMLHGAQPAAAAPWSGLLLDEWMEMIPQVAEDTGLVFHYDSPGSQAPQAVLVAVPPAPIKQWSFGLLVKIVQQTLFHAKVRAVDREHAEFLYGQMIPMIYLAQNTRTDTVSTTFTADSLLQSFLFRTEG